MALVFLRFILKCQRFKTKFYLFPIKTDKNNNHRKGSNLKNKRIKIRNGNVPEARDENKDAPQFDQQLSLYVDNYEGTNFEKGKY